MATASLIVRRRFAKGAPAASLALVLLLAVGCKPAPNKSVSGGQVFLEQQQSDKLNAYVVAQNKLIDGDNFGELLHTYLENNPRVGQPGAVLDSYSIEGRDVDAPLAALQQAVAMKPALPDLDVPAKALLAALQTFNPVLKEAEAYEAQQGYRTDKGAKAHEMHAALVSALKNANEATQAFGAALSIQTLRRDEADLAKMPPAGVSYHKLKVGLEVRKLGNAVNAALSDPTKIAALDTQLQSVVVANTALGTVKADPKASPAWDPVCAMYKEEVDKLIGSTNALRAAIKIGAGAHVRASYESWLQVRNDTVGKANECG